MPFKIVIDDMNRCFSNTFEIEQPRVIGGKLFCFGKKLGKNRMEQIEAGSNLLVILTKNEKVRWPITRIPPKASLFSNIIIRLAF